MRFITAGAAGTSPGTAAHANSLARLYRASRRRGSRLWWARRQRRVVAAAMVAVSHGGVGFLYYSSPGSPGVDGGALRDLIARLCTRCLGDGTAVVQAFTEPENTIDGAVLREAGMEHVAELLSMYCRATGREPAPESGLPPWTYATFDEIGRDACQELIRSTYADSLDCPKLLGIRPTEDVMESHRHTGLYTPEWWWAVSEADRPAGCILLNRLETRKAAYLVYMGIAPEFRGRGLGRAMLERASSVITRAGYDTIRLSVDSLNAPARRVYESFGFRQDHSRQVFAMISKRI